MPKVTVVIPVYNVKEYLDRCFGSIAAQTFSDWECILVDDGSTDGSSAICDDWAQKDTRFRVIHQQNGGVCKARNAGIVAAKGQYLMFCDQDDQYHPDLLSTILALQQQYPNDFIAWAFTQNADIFSKSIIKGQLEFYEKQDLCRFYMGHANIDNCMDTFIWNKLFPTDFVINQGVRFDLQYHHGTEDAAFMLTFWNQFFSCFPKAHMIWTSDVLYYWNDTNPTSVTKQKKENISHVQKQLDFYDLMFVPFEEIFHCPPNELAALAHHLQHQLCVGFVRDKQRHGPVCTPWRKRQFKALMFFFKSNRIYTAYYLPLLLHQKWLCRLICRSYDHSRWWYWKVYWLGYYCLGGNWQRI